LSASTIAFEYYRCSATNGFSIIWSFGECCLFNIEQWKIEHRALQALDAHFLE